MMVNRTSKPQYLSYVVSCNITHPKESLYHTSVQHGVFSDTLAEIHPVPVLIMHP